MGGEEESLGDRPIFGGNNLEKEDEKWARDERGLKGEFLFLFLKMGDITTCLHADKNDPREKQKCDEGRRDWIHTRSFVPRPPLSSAARS